MHDRCLLCLVEAVKIGHRRVERKERIEGKRRRLAVENKGAIATQAKPIGIADRGDGTQTIECAAQNNDQQARITAFGTRQLGQLRPGKQGAGTQQRGAAARQMGAGSHGSPPLEFRGHEEESQRLLPALGARDRLRGRRR